MRSRQSFGKKSFGNQNQSQRTFSSPPPPPPPPGPPPPLTIIRAALAGGRDDADIPCSPCAASELHPPKPPTPRTSSPSPPQQPALEKQGSLLRTLLPNLPSDDWAEMVGENDLPALPQSFHDAPDAFADVDADVADDVAVDLEADVADVSTHGGGDFGGDFGEGFEAPVDVAPPPGFQDSNAEHTPATDASAIALAALQAALHADRAAHSQAAQAMSAASADTHAMKRAEAKIHAVEEKIHAAMDERLALLERCFADQIENLRKAVEAGDAEREVLRGRVETLEATLRRRKAGVTYRPASPCTRALRSIRVNVWVIRRRRRRRREGRGRRPSSSTSRTFCVPRSTRHISRHTQHPRASREPGTTTSTRCGKTKSRRPSRRPSRR